jgi:hypothetical protein
MPLKILVFEVRLLNYTVTCYLVVAGIPHANLSYLNQKMIFSLKQLLLVALASLSVAQHVESPEETDVESTSWCKTNSDGFGGKPITSDNYKENKYYYELTISGTDTEAAISDLEIRIANYLLAETSLFDGCARRLKSVTPRSFRKLQQGGAVAITTRPDDFLYEDGKFGVFDVYLLLR